MNSNNNRHINDELLYNRNRLSEIDYYANRFIVERLRDQTQNTDPEPLSLVSHDSRTEPGVSDPDLVGVEYQNGLGYNQLPQLSEDDLVISWKTDLSHKDDVNDIQGINDEILEPGKFIKRAIEHMYNFGSDNHTLQWPFEWLDMNGFNGRYVHSEILKERQTLPELEKLTDRVPCTWTEHERAQLMQDHEDKVSSNIDEFIKNRGLEEKYVSMAHELESKYQTECKHLPILWTVLNIRVPQSLPLNRNVFLSRHDTEAEYFESMIMLIQSRYFIDVGKYNPYRDSVELLKDCGRWKTTFEQSDLKTSPLVVFVPDSGDIFVFLDLASVHVLSFYNDQKSLKMGQAAANALNAQCPWLTEEKKGPFQVHGLVSIVDATSDMLEHDMRVTTPLALEMMLHVLIDVDLSFDSIDMGALSQRLTVMCTECLQIPRLEDMYLARRWWAITRGELGTQTAAMDKYNVNSKRGFDTTAINNSNNAKVVVRSAWDFKDRMRLSDEYARHGNIRMVDMLHLLRNFRGTDAVTFSNNNMIQKRELVDTFQDPMCEGMSSGIFNSRVDFMNRSYSDNGGPRLFTQKELDYMMVNVKARNQRRRLTLRLFWGKPVFFLLDYQVSLEAMKRNQEAVNHVSLCKLVLTKSKKGKTPRVLEVEWLEGVFDNIYKLCAVPALTYLSAYFGVQVRQIDYADRKSLLIGGDGTTCVPSALYAANERMRALFESQGAHDWEPYNLSEKEAEDYVREIVYSLILVPRGGKTPERKELDSKAVKTKKKAKPNPKK